MGCSRVRMGYNIELGEEKKKSHSACAMAPHTA